MLTLVLLALASMPTTAAAQTPPESDAMHGTVTAGYRFTDVSGREEKYNELFNLQSGLRVYDFSLYSNANRKSDLYDSFFVTASGIGGEPFSGGQMTIKKNHVYDLRLDYQQSYYYWNRNDDQPSPSGLNGLTANHDWSTVRKIGSVNLSAYATSQLRFTFEYNRSGRGGLTSTTRVLDYPGASTAWGTFTRANPYIVDAPLDQHQDRLTGGINYSTHDWSLFYRTGYQWFNEDIHTTNLAAGQRSINIDDPRTALELLDKASWNESRQRRTPVSEFSYNGHPFKRLRLRGAYNFQRYQGPRSLDASFSGTARNGTANSPYSIAFHDDSTAHEVNHVIDQGLSFDISSKIIAHVDYRYFRYNIDSTINSQSVTNGAAPDLEETDTAWRQGTHTLDVALEFTPLRQLQIRPGIRLTKHDVTYLIDGAAEPQASERSKMASPMLTVYYAPSKNLTLRGDIRNTTNGTPYTRISPRTDLKMRWVAHYRMGEKFALENSMNVRNADYTTSDYHNKIRSNATNLTYNANKRLSLMGGFVYDSYLATASVTFLRGVAPTSAVWRDQTISRVWQAGIEAKPIRKVTLNLTGNYIRNTGVGEISGEAPTFGPLRWPLVTGTASFEVPHGRLSIDLQRTYYIEEIMTGDNFGANLLNIRWSTEF